MTQAYEELQNQISKQWMIALYKMEQSVRQSYAKEVTAISSAYTCKKSTEREIALLYDSQGTSGREKAYRTKHRQVHVSDPPVGNVIAPDLGGLRQSSSY